LPSSAALAREAGACCELELDRQAAQRKLERELTEARRDARFAVERAAAREAVGTWTRKNRRTDSMSTGGTQESPSQPFATPPQAFELYRAIDNHNLEYIARVRDHAFPLLLQKSAGEFPVIYASRCGERHRDIVIMLVGAFSR
jgi:hypothetical protein